LGVSPSSKEPANEPGTSTFESPSAKATQLEPPTSEGRHTSELETSAVESTAAEPVEVKSSEKTEGDESSKPRGRGRRRSRRGRGGGKAKEEQREEQKEEAADVGSESPRSGDEQNTDSDAPSEKSGTGRRRRRRRPRRKGAAAEEDRSNATAEEPCDTLAEDGVDEFESLYHDNLPSSLDEQADEEDHVGEKRSPGKRSHRSIPNWVDAIEIILAVNKENWAKEPQRGRGRGRGRRGGKSSSQKK